MRQSDPLGRDRGEIFRIFGKQSDMFASKASDNEDEIELAPGTKAHLMSASQQQIQFGHSE